MVDELGIKVEGQILTGWTSVNVTRGIEVMPPSFDIELTEKDPTNPDQISILPDSPCEIWLGEDQVLTGYVNSYNAEVSATSHTVRVTGRGQCQDLVDCSAFFGTLDNPLVFYDGPLDMVSIAKELAKPYDAIEVIPVNVGDNKPIYRFSLSIGETVYDAIEKMARYQGVLLYEDVNGNLVIDRAGSGQMNDGFRQAIGDGSAINVQQATISLTSDQRYSQYLVLLNAVNQQLDSPNALNVLGKSVDPNKNPVLRNRILLDVNPLFDITNGLFLCEQYANWLANRRWGRAQMVTLIADSWRDSTGKLWEPNAKVHINCPAVKANDLDWIIASVSYRRTLEEGTTAEVVCMPVEAFQVEPFGTEGSADIMSNLKKAGS